MPANGRDSLHMVLILGLIFWRETIILAFRISRKGQAFARSLWAHWRAGILYVGQWAGYFKGWRGRELRVHGTAAQGNSIHLKAEMHCLSPTPRQPLVLIYPSNNPKPVQGWCTDLAWNSRAAGSPHLEPPPVCWEQGVPRRLRPPASSTSLSAQRANTGSWKKSDPSFRSWTLGSDSFCSFLPALGCIFSWCRGTGSSWFYQQQQTE